MCAPLVRVPNAVLSQLSTARNKVQRRKKLAADRGEGTHAHGSTHTHTHTHMHTHTQPRTNTCAHPTRHFKLNSDIGYFKQWLGDKE